MRLAKLILAALLAASPAFAQSDDDADDTMGGDPHGGGAMGQGGPGGQGGHGGGAHGGVNVPGMFQPPPDTVVEDPSLPAGTIAITIADADDKPVPRESVTLGVLHSSVAKGDSRSRTVRQADDGGNLRFDGQQAGAGIAYRVSVSKNGATFGASPFQLPAARGIRVRLHEYPVTHDLSETKVAMQAAVYAELKDDRVQLQSVLELFNFSSVAWVPENVLLELPPEFTALRANEDMGDRGVDAIDKKGARLRGTFGPGRWEVQFTWQLPYSGTKDMTFEVGLPPHVAVARVLAQASQQMTLDVQGFPPAQSQASGEGQRVLITEKQAMREQDSLRQVRVTLGNLPTSGPWAGIASGVTAVLVLGGLGFAFSQHAPSTKKRDKTAGQAQLLADLAELERLHRSGEIGPKTYERARREIIDALARLLATDKKSTAAEA